MNDCSRHSHLAWQKHHLRTHSPSIVRMLGGRARWHTSVPQTECMSVGGCILPSEISPCTACLPTSAQVHVALQLGKKKICVHRTCHPSCQSTPGIMRTYSIEIFYILEFRFRTYVHSSQVRAHVALACCHGDAMPHNLIHKYLLYT